MDLSHSQFETIASTAVVSITLLIAIPVAAAQQTTAGESVRSAVVTRIDTELVIDGSLEESPWRQVPTIGDLIQREPEALSLIHI